jgi:benzoyl-CoA-dihydrodiol lyase
LPGTGGLTRLSDKRKVRRDLADVFSTLAEGVRGKRAAEWRLIDESAEKSQFDKAVSRRVEAMKKRATKTGKEKGIAWTPLKVERDVAGARYTHVTLNVDVPHRLARITIEGPGDREPTTVEAIHAAGVEQWALRAFRELDDALLHLRFNYPTVGLLLVETKGDVDRVVALDRALFASKDDWFVREILLHMRRVLRRIDTSARSVFALAREGSCFAGSLLEIALAADRLYMLDGDAGPKLALSPLNGGILPTFAGVSRLVSRFWGEPERAKNLMESMPVLTTQEAMKSGLVTFAPDDIDWDDEIRVVVEERTSYSPDALTGMEQNLRCPGPETMATKIFGRLSAWQNWIFQRPNAVGAGGALTRYGKPERPEFDFGRT